ncbi:MAG: hypothetical protein HKN28_15950 [Alphaproteobacteria bacterium]|nr:hypothetical protein [Alphaproteobacteria bacterium]
MDKKIAMLGAGANGSVMAADLTEAGLDVTMIDMWGAHVEKMRADGLTITSRDGDTNVQVNAHHLSDVCTFTDKFDVVLLGAKGYDTVWMTEFIKPYLADDGVVVGFQNCMTAETIAEIVGVERTVGCVVELASHMFEPGEVHRSTLKAGTWYGVGAFDAAQTDHVETVAEIFRHSGKVDIIDDILSAKWMKLIINAMIMGSMAVLGGTPEQVLKQNGPAFEKRARDWFLRAGEEALAVGQSLDYKIVPILGLKPEDVTNTNNLLETMLDKILHDIGPSAVNTSLQDYMKGRRSETALIHGMVAEESRKQGRAAPVCEAIAELDQRIHAGELKPDPGNLDLPRL